MDSNDTLSRIYVKTDNNQIKSLYDLKTAKDTVASGLLTPFKVQSTAYISSDLNDDQMSALRGFLYITTAKQSNDFNFKVYDIDLVQIVRPSLLICDPCTMVFLNTNENMVPVQSSTITTWRQSADSTVKMYKGYPTDEEEVNSSQIFANPIQTITDPPRFIQNVEKFSVSLGAFYFKTTSDFYFAISPFYLDPDLSSTTAYTTTGLITKSVSQTPKKVTIDCLRDTIQRDHGRKYNRVNANARWKTPANQIFGWLTYKIGQNLTVSSESSTNGEFFVQYYIIQGDQISSTFAPTNATSPSVETTTKGAGILNLVVSILTLVLGSFV
ncbi:hypothetical protein L5515_006938 [Caenorhabditis briggsae]|uniref:Uncharacterized protein n=1 Tax=Caenorhabditis briggsae TaxID=6238 RepID=A0AAE9JIS0_CAEBR|nr:hypothetical protein L5515_006938 [Caenorhabditis briggsae]